MADDPLRWNEGMEAWKTEQLRELPAVDEVLRHPLLQTLADGVPHHRLVYAVRSVVDDRRQRILQAASPDDAPRAEMATLARLTEDYLRREERPRLRRVINATGVILHTNLGRSVLAEEAAQALQTIATSYSNLEYDLERGQRGKRYDHLRDLLRRLSGAEDALVVNNNAAAVLICLQALAAGRQVIVSRGELVEIGGSFRVPEIMALSGAILREVGATNKTRLRDYENAIGSDTALLLKVHQSNYRIVGFTEEAPVAEIVELGRQRGVPVMVDLGSGSFLPSFSTTLPPAPFGDEPTVPEVVAGGADLVTFSGDKLLGGPQAGVIVGKHSLIEALQRHPLNRALRVDKFTLAALESTLRLYLDPERARLRIPTQRFLSLVSADLELAAKDLCGQLSKVLPDPFKVEVVDEQSTPGGGSLPGFELPTKAVALRCNAVSAAAIERRLRTSEPPVIVRIQNDVVLLDVRTLLPRDFSDLVEACASLASLLAAPPD